MAGTKLHIPWGDLDYQTENAFAGGGIALAICGQRVPLQQFAETVEDVDCARCWQMRNTPRSMFRQTAIDIQHGDIEPQQGLTADQIATQCMICGRFRQSDGLTWEQTNPMPGAPVSHSICPDDWKNQPGVGDLPYPYSHNNEPDLQRLAAQMPATYTPDDPLDMDVVNALVDDLHTGWWERDEQTQRQAIANAFRAALTSPRQNLKWNSIVYQDMMGVPPEETNPDTFETLIRDRKQKWDAFGQQTLDMLDTQDDQELIDYGQHAIERYMPGIWNNVRNAALPGQYIEELRQAAMADIAQGGDGRMFRDELLRLNIPGIGPKVAAFVWLLLAPKTSRLATIDVHMMRLLGQQMESPKDYAAYIKLEDELDAMRQEMGYDVPLGAFQWALWDKQRTPGYHQDHTPLRPLDPVDWRKVDWAPQLRVRKSPPAEPMTGQEELFPTMSGWKRKSKSNWETGEVWNIINSDESLYNEVFRIARRGYERSRPEHEVAQELQAFYWEFEPDWAETFWEPMPEGSGADKTLIDWVELATDMMEEVRMEDEYEDETQSDTTFPSEWTSRRKKSMPYYDNTWYHVTERERLPQIAQQGLVGRAAGVAPKWHKFPAAEDAVYLHPNSWLAHNYGEMTQGYPASVKVFKDPVVLRVNSLDKTKLAPDHEMMESYLEGLNDRIRDTEEGMGNEWEIGLKQWIDQYETDNSRPEINYSLGYDNDANARLQHYIDMVAAMPPDWREQIARDISTISGDSVMYYGSIPPQNIEVGSANIMDNNGEWQDQWPDAEEWAAKEPEDSSSPEWDQWEEDRDRALDQWASGKNWIDKDMDATTIGLDDPENDDLADSYDWVPITQALQPVSGWIKR